MKLEREIQRFYKTSQKYFSKLREKEFKEWFSKYHGHLKSREGGLVLDVGCGVGQVVNKLAMDELTAIGIDISPIGIKSSHEARNSKRASFIVASCYKMPFRDNVFHAVGCFDVLEHLINPEACMDEMIRVTVDDGKIIIAGPNLLCPVYASSLKGLVGNMKLLLRSLVRFKGRLNLEHREPILDDSTREIELDLDAVTLLDPVTVKRLLTEKGVKITYQSSYLGSRRIIEMLSILPLLRSIGGGIFLVGRKCIKNYERS